MMLYSEKEIIESKLSNAYNSYTGAVLADKILQRRMLKGTDVQVTKELLAKNQQMMKLFEQEIEDYLAYYKLVSDTKPTFEDIAKKFGSGIVK